MCFDSTQSTVFSFSYSKEKPQKNLGNKPELDNRALMQDLYWLLAFP